MSRSPEFAIGQSVRRSEDPKLVTGKGRYTDDISLPGQAYGYVLRSPFAHGTIGAIDISAARQMPGVLAIYTGADLEAAGYGSLPANIQMTGRDGTPMAKPPRPLLAVGKVTFVGDPVAFVVAESASQARDAAEAIELDIDPLPAVTSAEEALKPGAPQIHEEAPGNLAIDFHSGDSEAVDRAIAAADHVTRLSLSSDRLVVAAMEPRAALARFEPETGRYEVHVPSQGVFAMHNFLAAVLDVEPKMVHLLTDNVGGSFGMKSMLYPETVLVCHAAKDLGRPVKWTSDRSGAFVSDSHGRDIQVTGTLALDKLGNFLALRLEGFGNIGAHLGHVAPIYFTANIAKNVVSVYRTPLIEVGIKCAFTNTTFTGPYRGAGRPDANYLMERLIDTAAEEMGLDRVKIRKRNQIKPSQIPYRAPSDLTYDSGDFPGVLNDAVELSDWHGFKTRRREAKKRGKLLGRGIGSYLEVTAPPNKEMGGIRFEEDGTVSIITGTLDYGQGHAAPFAQVLSEKLGVPFDRIRLRQGDSDEVVFGAGTGGSRSAMMSGAAIAEASEKVVEKGKQLAGVALEVAVGDIEFEDGRFSVAGTDLSIDIMELADKVRQGLALPDGTPDGLDVTHLTDVIPSSFPNGSHVAEVEIDPETGVVEVVRYTMVNDFGTILNPMLVEGQLHGGVMQGIGQALMETTLYDEEGQLLTGSFTDYAMPRADNAPDFVFASHPVPATTNPLGVKGCGEAGCAGSLSAIMNAVVDALRPYGVTHMEMPVTPEKVWRAINGN
ncbi:xanthine dehydrogenase family protein molybdopterin-binding subunit [Microbaculum marinum]|uniref:Xanthine dehydrogenase family protein molybdopterin-binding subunit n=1 Tax=Microbaculum marinum TaxID=1764581 RepID=A0AAW9RW73_9HYPH